MGRKPLKKLRKKDEKITENWLQLIIPVFQQNGFKDYTMDEVVKIAGVSKATFYKYYSSKEKLIDSIIEAEIHTFSSFQEKLADTSVSYYDRYFNAIHVTAQAMRQISSKFLDDLQTCYPTKWKAIEEFKGYAVSILEEFYAAGVSSGELIHVNPKLIAVLDHIFFAKMSDPAFLANLGLSMEEAFVGYMTLKNEGIIQNKSGIEAINKRIDELNKSTV